MPSRLASVAKTITPGLIVPKSFPIVLRNTYMECAMKPNVIHCRVTEEQHKAIKAAAEAAGLSITAFVIRAALSESPSASR